MSIVRLSINQNNQWRQNTAVHCTDVNNRQINFWCLDVIISKVFGISRSLAKVRLILRTRSPEARSVAPEARSVRIASYKYFWSNFKSIIYQEVSPIPLQLSTYHQILENYLSEKITLYVDKRRYQIYEIYQGNMANLNFLILVIQTSIVGIQRLETQLFTVKARKHWNKKTTFKISHKKSNEHETQQLCRVNRPKLMFIRCLVKLLLTI